MNQRFIQSFQDIRVQPERRRSIKQPVHSLTCGTRASAGPNGSVAGRRAGVREDKERQGVGRKLQVVRWRQRSAAEPRKSFIVQHLQKNSVQLHGPSGNTGVSTEPEPDCLGSCPDEDDGDPSSGSCRNPDRNLDPLTQTSSLQSET